MEIIKINWSPFWKLNISGRKNKFSWKIIKETLSFKWKTNSNSIRWLITNFKIVEIANFRFFFSRTLRFTFQFKQSCSALDYRTLHHNWFCFQQEHKSHYEVESGTQDFRRLYSHVHNNGWYNYQVATATLQCRQILKSIEQCQRQREELIITTWYSIDFGFEYHNDVKRRYKIDLHLLVSSK